MLKVNEKKGSTLIPSKFLQKIFFQQYGWRAWAYLVRHMASRNIFLIKVHNHAKYVLKYP